MSIIVDSLSAPTVLLNRWSVEL